MIGDAYEIKEELGRGAFSIVKKVVNKKTGEVYAVKIIDKTKACGEAEKKTFRNRSYNFEKSFSL